ncbi:VanZ family protein [Humidisolicoccus flavus]|uniref:VanZ family protein n=1 Tax=Humidisolicoccus flavus TaxID=3111414 RepID=UPI00324C3967
MSSYVYPGVVATFVGFAVAIMLLVPLIAMSYRKRGGVSPARALGWFALAVSACAIWTYTLLPIPDGPFECRVPNLDMVQPLRDVRAEGYGSLGQVVRNSALWQLGLNVLLFMPIGFLIRALFARGIFVATFVGFVVSLVVETTQLTGIWGAYDCAYRLFDVADLATNTFGALLGSIVAAMFVSGRRRATRVPLSAPVTISRRLLGMFCDLLAFGTLGFLATFAMPFVFAAIDRPAPTNEVFLGLLLSVSLIPQLIMVLSRGVSIGEWAVLLRPLRGSFRCSFRASSDSLSALEDSGFCCHSRFRAARGSRSHLPWPR